MKKVFALTLFAGVVFACSRKTTPQSEIIISNQEKQANKEEVVVTNTGSSDVNAGMTIYTTRCGRCHGLKPVEKYTSKEWENILKIMTVKANLTDKESKEVTVYVMEHARK